MAWGMEHGDPLKFYSLPPEAKAAFLAVWFVKDEENKKKQKAKAKKLPASLSLFDKPSWE